MPLKITVVLHEQLIQFKIREKHSYTIKTVVKLSVEVLRHFMIFLIKLIQFKTPNFNKKFQDPLNFVQNYLKNLKIVLIL